MKRFLGNYDELEGSIFEDAALHFSGGLHQNYIIEECQNSTDKDHPNLIEVFEIIRIAVLKKDIVGCILEDVGFDRFFF